MLFRLSALLRDFKGKVTGMKIKSITIEIDGEDKTLTLEQVRELHKVLSEVLQADDNQQAVKQDLRDELVRAYEQAQKGKGKVIREPVYIPMPYPVYPEPFPLIRPYWEPTTWTVTCDSQRGSFTDTGNSAGVKLLGCTVHQ